MSSSVDWGSVQGVGIVLLFLGGGLTALWSLLWMPDKLSFLAAAFLSILVGFFLLDWRVSLLFFGILGGLFLRYRLGEIYYRKRFPVFSSPPLETLREENGFTHYLHLREWDSRFIIGIDYELEVDGSLFRYRTRWQDRFPTREAAETELRRRYAVWLEGGSMRGLLR